MIILIDNYDSFVFNLARYIRELDQDCMVVRNDQMDLKELERLDPKGFILSPGPCGPDDAGICLDLVNYFYKDKAILGVCLGHQVIAQSFGGQVTRYAKPMHGKASKVEHEESNLFKGLPSPMKVGRYHSLSVQLSGDEPIQVDAESPDGEIMALSHKEYPVFGVQFHPESILTEHGHDLLKNFLEHC